MGSIPKTKSSKAERWVSGRVAPVKYKTSLKTKPDMKTAVTKARIVNAICD